MADRYWVPGGTGNYNSTTNWSATSGGASGASVPAAGDNVFFNANSGAGTATVNVGSNCASLNLTGFTGTIVFSANLGLNGTAFNLGTGGYTISTPSTFGLAFNTALTVTSNGTVWTGIINVGNTTITLADNLTISGTWSYTTSGTATVNGNTLNISGNLTHSGTAIATGTTAIVFNGTGTWSHTSTGVLRNNVTINTTGTLTLGTTVRYNTGTLTYTSGTVVTTGNTLEIGASTTLNTNGITWNNISAVATANITLGSNLTLTGTLINGAGGATTLSFTLGGNSLISTNANLTLSGSSTFTMPANQTFKTLTITSAATINTNTLTITENLTINANLTGTTAIIYAGTGTWSASSSSGVINNNLTINTSGTLTISGIVYKYAGVFTYTSGTIIDTTGTVQVQSLTLNIAGFTFRKLLVNGGINLASNVNAITFGTWYGSISTSFSLGAFSLNFTHLELGTGSVPTTLPTAWVCQDITFTNPAANQVINGFSITINGNILQSGNGITSGSTSFIYAGTGSWTQTGVGYLSNSFTINTAGTLTFISANLGGGIFTYTAGTVITTGSTLYIRASGTIMNHGSIIWDNVILGNSAGSGGVASITLNNKLTCLGTLTFGISNTTFGGTDGTFDTYGLVLGIDTSNRTTTLVSTKTYRVRQSLTCTQATDLARVLLRSSVGGSQAIFTLDPGATIDVGFVNATDIDSSLGRPIYSYRGVFSNTLNWGLLPTDNTRSSRSTFVG